MSDILIREDELHFLLWDWLKADQILAQPRFQGHDRATVDALLAMSAKLAEEHFLPHYKSGDREEPRLDESGNVRILPEIAEAARKYGELGLVGAGFPEQYGGMNAPSVAVVASMAQFMAANIAAAAYPMLTAGNARIIVNFGSQAQIEEFAAPQIAGHAFGTMCLSEPQAGSSLGDIRTRAARDSEDNYGKRFRLFGNKMWISGGDHNIGDNIIHLVLAKIPDADGALPEGTKGISLFIAPKFLPGDAGRNDIVVAGLNHKMGYRGTSNCLLNFGEGCFHPHGSPGAVGYLIGEPGQGLSIMFQMMNEARISVGLGAAALAYRGYRHALRYASERTQGRALETPRAGGASTAIIRHPDVQRMLLAQKCYAEGALALVFYCASLVDREQEDAVAAELLALLTPVAKTWSSEWGLAANDLAIQVHGGYGYTRDFDVEQLYRDNRLNPIHEGTTGIQALDLLGRKILRSDGQALNLLGEAIAATTARASGIAQLRVHAEALICAWNKLNEAIAILRDAPIGRALANATAFLAGFGHVVVAWLWLDQALVCVAGAPKQGQPLHLGKLRACRFFFEMELPKTTAWFDISASLTDVAADVPIDQF
jgi:alkylation response protein AidB-like acyl-CoA dehydrogenase